MNNGFQQFNKRRNNLSVTRRYLIGTPLQFVRISEVRVLIGLLV